MMIDNISDARRFSVTAVSEKSAGDKVNLTKADIMQVSRALSGEYIARLQTQAYEDARVGVCMPGGYLNTVKKAAKMLCENGESVAGFHKKSGQWKISSTNAEMQFRWESDQIYLAAYQKAVKEIDIEKKKTGSSVNFERKG